MDYNQWFENEFPHIKLNPPGSILADTAHFLVSYVRKFKPRSVLEMGSGVSTAILASEIQKYQGELVTIEHEKEYIDYTKEFCQKNGINNPQIIHAPIIKSTFQNVPNFLCYDSAQIPKKEYDFIFIDGPPGYKKNHPGRRGTFYLIWDLLASSSIVFLDDGDRINEQKAVMEWMTVFGDKLNVTYHQFQKPGFEIRIKK